MATEVKRYLAKDGTEFQTPESADRHDVAVAFCKSVEPESARHVYDAICKAQKLGWSLFEPTNAKAAS